VENFDAVEGKKFKIDPQRMLYSLQRGTPPDFHLQLVRSPQFWFNFVAPCCSAH
jgi:hypothetical protein